MKNLKLIILIVVLLLLFTGCSKPKPWGTIEKIVNYSSSGEVSESFQWDREIVFEDGMIDITNNGLYHDDVINVGRWQIPVHKKKYGYLIEALEKVDPDLVKEIPKDEEIVSGGANIYSIYYTERSEPLVLDQDYEYENADDILNAIHLYWLNNSLPDSVGVYRR